MPKNIFLWLMLALSASIAHANQVPSHPPTEAEIRANQIEARGDLLRHQRHIADILQTATNMNSFPLWPDGAPGALDTNTTDIPTLTVYLPTNSITPLRAAMVVCPGGGYVKLAPHEGDFYARWLSERGVAAFVLKYRLGTNGYKYPVMLQDAARALRTVRAKAAEWNVDPQRIGMMGSSAGGHVTSLVITRFDAGDTNAADPVERVSSRPDLAVLCYPVIEFGEYGHKGSKAILLGTNPPPGLVEELSSQLHVVTNTPPCFLWHTSDDASVPVENSLNFAAALKRAGVLYDLHIYEHGKHGLGLGPHDDYDPTKFLPWTHELERWLKDRGFIK